jgi:molybdopterin synthase sulfur carrier subunit
MTVKINIPQVLQQYTDSLENVEVEGSTIRECLDNLVKKYPEIQNWIFNSKEAPLVITLINNELVAFDQIDKKVNKNDKIALIPVIAGG